VEEKPGEGGLGKGYKLMKGKGPKGKYLGGWFKYSGKRMVVGKLGKVGGTKGLS